MCTTAKYFIYIFLYYIIFIKYKVYDINNRVFNKTFKTIVYSC